MSQAQPRMNAMQFGIILLTIATALIHLYLAVAKMNFDLLFIANGLGYIGLLGLLYLPVPALAPYRNLVRWALIAFTTVTLVAWLSFGTRDAIAYVTKAIEVLLIILLFLEGQQDRGRPVR